MLKRLIQYIFLGIFVTSTAGAMSCEDVLSSDSSLITDKIISNNKFKRGRGFSDYVKNLGRIFMQDFAEVVRKKGHILDGGAGEAVAASEIVFEKNATGNSFSGQARTLWRWLTREPIEDRPTVTAVTYKLERKDLPLDHEQFHLLKDQFLEDIPLEVLKTQGKWVDLLIDYFGASAYTGRLTELFQKYMDVLNVGGHAYIFLGTKINDTPSDLLKTKIMVNGKALNLIEWLNQVEGLKIENYQVNAEGLRRDILRITKLQPSITIPEVEFVKILKKGPPPDRLFRQK